MIHSNVPRRHRLTTGFPGPRRMPRPRRGPAVPPGRPGARCRSAALPPCPIRYPPRRRPRPRPADLRRDVLVAWTAATLDRCDFTLAPASADASFRRYFRVTFDTPPARAAGRPTLIVMDAPPAQENSAPFLHVAQLLRAAGVHAPEVLAADLDRGFLLLTDLGNRTYLAALDAASAPRLYSDAIDALIRWQCASREHELPPYDEALLRRELDLFPDWYVARHLGVTLTAAQAAYARAGVPARPRQQSRAAARVRPSRLPLAQPDGLRRQPRRPRFPGRGLRSDHLRSVLAAARRVRRVGRGAADRLGGALLGARAQGRPSGRRRLRRRSGAISNGWASSASSRCWASSRGLYHRDGKAGYLADMPRVMAYLRGACARYRALGPLLELLDELEGRQHAAGSTF